MNRSLILLICFLLFFYERNASHAENEVEQEFPDWLFNEIVEQLNHVRKKAEERKEQLISKGIGVLTLAASNENEAMALFEECYRKAEFTDKNKTDKEWREWKLKNKDRLNSPLYKSMVMYQCRWALISLKAGMEAENDLLPERYLPQAVNLIRDIYSDEKMVIARNKNPFAESIFNGAIGTVFSLKGCVPKSWPCDIFSTREIMDKLALEPCRKKKDIAALRKAWDFYMQLEKIKNDIFKKHDIKDGGIISIHSAMTKYDGDKMTIHNASIRKNNYETMRWQKEEDCYKIGDCETAANNMLHIIQQTQKPKQQLYYMNIMKNLLGEETESVIDSDILSNMLDF